MNIRIIVQTCRNASVFQQLAQRLTSLVGADHRQQRDMTTERNNVAGHVGSATGADFFLADMNHGYRGFRRNTRDFTEPVTVQHYIANNEQAGVGEINRGHGIFVLW